MSLLSIAVKKARYIGVQAQQFNTYVTLKLQNVKSTTITVKGANPCWEQDFLFETNEINIGLLVEVWCKGILWDRALGYYYLLLPAIPYSNENGFGQWVSLDSELEMKGGEVVGTKTPTGHTLLIDCRFELPFDAQNTNAIDLQQKLEMLNSTVDNEIRSEQGHRQLMYNIAHSGYSEDSDYTSDFNYPVDGQGANSSISQFCTAATQLGTSQNSLETSRENSYERDDQQVPTNVASSLTPAIFSDYSAKGLRYNEPYPGDDSCQRYMNYSGESSEPLFYNSRPKYYKEYREEDCYNDHYNYQVLKINNTRIYNDIQNSPNMAIKSIRKKGSRSTPSLEKQRTLYNDHLHFDNYICDTRTRKFNEKYLDHNNYHRDNIYHDNIEGCTYQDERYGPDNEDRQWDSGGRWFSELYNEIKSNKKILPQRPFSSIDIHRPDYGPAIARQCSCESEDYEYSDSSTRKRKFLQPQQHSFSRLEGSGKKLPPTPTKSSSSIVGQKPTSLPSTPARYLPRPITSLKESCCSKLSYNEDYNYAYYSQDNLQHGICGISNAIHIINDIPSYQPNTNDVPQMSHINYDTLYLESKVQDAHKLVEKFSHNADYQSPYLHLFKSGFEKTYTNPSGNLKVSESLPTYQHEDTHNIITDDSLQTLSYDQNNIRRPFQSFITRQCHNEQNKDEYVNQCFDGKSPKEYLDSSCKNNEHLIYSKQFITDIYNQSIIPDVSKIYNNENYDYDNTDVMVSTRDEPYIKQYDQATSLTIPHDNHKNLYKMQLKSVDNKYCTEEAKTAYSKKDNSNLYENNDQNEHYTNFHNESYKNLFESEYNKNLYDQVQPNVSELFVAIPQKQMKTNEYIPETKEMPKCNINPLLQQNLYILESKHVDRNFFCTNSVSSTDNNKAFNEYSTTKEKNSVCSPMANLSENYIQIPSQCNPILKNATNQNELSNIDLNTVSCNFLSKPKHFIRRKSSQEEFLESNNDSQLNSPSQINQHLIQSSQKQNFTIEDSYTVDNCTDDNYIKKESSSQLERKDSYNFMPHGNFSKPSLRITESYYIKDHKQATCNQNITTPQPISRVESYQRGYFKNQQLIDDTEIIFGNAVIGEYKTINETLDRYERGEETIKGIRDNTLIESHLSDSSKGSMQKQDSLDESVQMDTPPRSPPDPSTNEELIEISHLPPVPTQIKERSEMTPRQRWHVAFNKIVIQLNVSKLKNILIFASNI